MKDFYEHEPSPYTLPSLLLFSLLLPKHHVLKYILNKTNEKIPTQTVYITYCPQMVLGTRLYLLTERIVLDSFANV